MPIALSPRRRSICALLIIAIVGFCSPFIKAQKAPGMSEFVGRQLYEKLWKTQKEYQAALATGDSLEVAEMCYRLGKRYGGLGDHETAQKWFIRSLRIREPQGPSEDIGKVYLFMSHHQVVQKKFFAALQTVHKAMANFKIAGSRHGLMSGSIALAGIHALGWESESTLKRTTSHYSFDSTLYYAKQAERLALALKIPYDIANAYALKGGYLLKTNPKLGIVYLKKADTIFLREKENYGIINSSFALAEAYLNLRQPAEAKKWLYRAQQFIDRFNSGDYEQRRRLLEVYTRFYEQTGRWQKALETQKKSHVFVVGALNADREGAITRIGIEYETQKKENQLKAQQQELALKEETLLYQKRLIWSAIGVGLLAAIASIVFYQFSRKYKRLSQKNAALVMEQNHRVKNNLQQVTNLLTLQSNRLTNEEAKNAVTEGLLRMEAIALVHQRLYNSDQLVEINLSSFLPELIENVLRSYNYAHLQPHYTLDPIWLHVDQAVPVGLIVNELVTNSCKHAFPQHAHPTLAITCKQTSDDIYLEVSDNGPGFTPKVDRQSFGLKLIQAFAERLKGKTSLAKEGRTFCLSFPIMTPQTIH